MSYFRLISIGLAFLASCATVAQTVYPSGLWRLSLDEEQELVFRSAANIVIFTAPVPGAEELGQLEVEKWESVETAENHQFTVGWHCSKEMFFSLDSILSSEPLHYIADHDTAEAHFKQVLGIQMSLPNVDNSTWRDAGVAWMMERLRLYETGGKPSRVPNQIRYAWRSWMRDTLAVIHSRAKDAGWSRENTAEAAALWVYCHIGPDEWTAIKSDIEKAVAGGAVHER